MKIPTEGPFRYAGTQHIILSHGDYIKVKKRRKRCFPVFCKDVPNNLLIAELPGFCIGRFSTTF